jgi:hypothetical protein
MIALRKVFIIIALIQEKLMPIAHILPALEKSYYALMKELIIAKPPPA